MNDVEHGAQQREGRHEGQAHDHVADLADDVKRQDPPDVALGCGTEDTGHHGEGGCIVGAKLNGRVLIVDDVITAGTAIREAVDIIQAEGASTSAVLIALDRQERGKSELSAIQEVRRDYGIDVYSIVTMADLIEYLQTDDSYSRYLDAMQIYRRQYGV